MQLLVERVHHAGGNDLDRPLLKGSISAVVSNPFVGRFPDDLEPWMASLASLGDQMALELRDTVQVEGREVQGYGKGAIVGVSGDMEIAAAWHVPAGAALRAALGGPKAMVPASKKVGTLGSQLDVPLNHLHASYLRSHYDVVAVVVADGPRPDEVVYTLVMSTGPRPHHRIGGFTIDDVVGADGLR